VSPESLRAIDPLRLMAADPRTFPAFFESTARAAQTGRIDLLPVADGRYVVLGTDGCVRDESGCVIGDDFAAALDAAWQRERFAAHPGAASDHTNADAVADTGRSADADTDAATRGQRATGVDSPFRGGWVLYLGYEAAAAFEPAVRLPAFGGAGLPVALAIRTPAVWWRTHEDGRGGIACGPGFEFLIDRAAALAGEVAGHSDGDGLPPLLGIDEDAPHAFLGGVHRVLDYLHAGDVFQVNLSRGWQARFAAAPNPVALYRRLRRIAPAPFAGLLRWQDRAIVSASPERLLRVRGRHIDTRPIAGTRPRGSDATADATLRAELIAHPKERAEHVMLIDLERNDLGRVCVPGSIRVDELMSLESYAHVHHIVSNVSGQLRDDATPGSILRALFPGGTITGCPKVRCMQIIAELEGEGRGPYTGAMGYLDRSGDMDLNILIRSAWLDGNRFGFRAGAGIVVDSDPARELAETRAKARGMLALLGR
jgi:anthranilate synthase component 1